MYAICEEKKKIAEQLNFKERVDFHKTNLLIMFNSLGASECDKLLYFDYFATMKLEHDNVSTDNPDIETALQNDIIKNIVAIKDVEILNYINIIVSDILEDEKGGIE